MSAIARGPRRRSFNGDTALGHSRVRPVVHGKLAPVQYRGTGTAPGRRLARDHRRLAASSHSMWPVTRLMGVDDSGTLVALKPIGGSLSTPRSPNMTAASSRRPVMVCCWNSSVFDAVRCAVDVQRGMTERNEGVATDKRFNFASASTLATSSLMGTIFLVMAINVMTRLEALADPEGFASSSRAIKS